MPDPQRSLEPSPSPFSRVLARVVAMGLGAGTVAPWMAADPLASPLLLTGPPARPAAPIVRPDPSPSADEPLIPALWQGFSGDPVQPASFSPVNGLPGSP